MTTNNLTGGFTQPGSSTTIKTYSQDNPQFWKNQRLPGTNVSASVLTPTSVNSSVLISKNLTILGDINLYGHINYLSDINLKKNITTISEDISNKILKLRPRQFEFISDPLEKVHYGFIAQELETELPELVEQINKTEFKGVNYLELIPLLVYQIQNMRIEIDLLKKQMKKLN
jgi:hypothetical protein